MTDQAADPFIMDPFIIDPGAWADPARAAPLIAPGLREETARHLLTSPRLARRASRWLADRLGPGDPATLEPVDLWLARTAVATLETVALHAGAVWHARRIRALLLGADIALLCDRLGSEARAVALRYAALAPDDGSASDLNRDAATDAAALADDIERDGARCLAAWIASLPDWAASRVRLKLPDRLEPPVSPDRCAAAAQIVRTIAAEALAA
jgi:hypothetical protein